MDIQKIEQIENSYINGQKRQMVQQIKEYGINKFMVDYYEYNDRYLNYEDIVYTFFLLNS